MGISSWRTQFDSVHPKEVRERWFGKGLDAWVRDLETGTNSIGGIWWVDRDSHWADRATRGGQT